MSTLAFYIIFTLATVYSVYTYLQFVPSMYVYVTSRKSTSYSEQRKQALEQLATAPALGQFFYQDLISEYVSSNEWEKVHNFSKLAVESPITRNSFPVWYYKATAECLLNHADQCERSARIANSMAPNGHEDVVSQLFNLAKVMKNNQKIRLINNKDQIMIVLDSQQDDKVQKQEISLSNQKHKQQTDDGPQHTKNEKHIDLTEL